MLLLYGKITIVTQMKLVIGLIVLGILIISPTYITARETIWSSILESEKRYHWKAEKSEIRDLTGSEKYTHGVGGMNIGGGDNEIYLRSVPNSTFDFFKGDRLNISITVERDMVIGLEPQESLNSTDWWLLILPLTMNEISFFDLLFSEIYLLENLTQSTYIDSDVGKFEAWATFEHNNLHSIEYRWDIQTGFLILKKVSTPSGKQLIIVPGKGIGFGISGINDISYTAQLSLFFYLIIISIVMPRWRKR
jgi:hypothetical protein